MALYRALSAFFFAGFFACCQGSSAMSRAAFSGSTQIGAHAKHFGHCRCHKVWANPVKLRFVANPNTACSGTWHVSQTTVIVRETGLPFLVMARKGISAYTKKA